MRAVQRVVDALLCDYDRPPDSASRDVTVVLFAIALLLMLAGLAILLSPAVPS